MTEESRNKENESLAIKLARLDEKLDYVLRDIKELKDGTSGKIQDHEMRIRTLEENSDQMDTFSKLYIFLGVVTVGMLIWHLTGFKL